MNKQIKEEWIAALRSGNYQQGNGILRSFDNKYCCAGVLCDILIKRGIGEWKQDSDSQIYNYAGSQYSLTREVLDAVGIHGLAQNVQVKTEDGDHTIYYLNDRMDLDFNQIADIIEKQF